MASVHLDFVVPDRPDLTKLLIYESATDAGPWALIETVSPIGSYPSYISEYTTDDASDATNWFSIEFEDSKGARTERSLPMQGGTQTLVSMIVDRVLLRDPNLREEIVLQEAEIAISDVFHTNDPYEISVDQPPKILGGLTLYTLARVYLSDLLVGGSSTEESFTAGLVSIKSASGTSAQRDLKSIQAFLAEAEKALGMNFSSLIMQMAPLEMGSDMRALVAMDQTRLIVEFE